MLHFTATICFVCSLFYFYLNIQLVIYFTYFYYFAKLACYLLISIGFSDYFDKNNRQLILSRNLEHISQIHSTVNLTVTIVRGVREREKKESRGQQKIVILKKYLSKQKKEKKSSSTTQYKSVLSQQPHIELHTSSWRYMLLGNILKYKSTPKYQNYSKPDPSQITPNRILNIMRKFSELIK